MGAAHDEETLRAAVCADPGDDGPRLRLAEHYEQLGDPRGEFIRLQCARAVQRGPARFGLDLKIRAVEPKSRARWDCPSGMEVTFRRGLAAAVTMSTQQLTAASIVRLELEPVETLELDVRSEGALEPLWASPSLLRRLNTLRLRGAFGVSACASLAACTYLPSLRRLGVSGSGVTPRAVETLAATVALPGVSSLTLSGCEVEDAGAEALCESRLLNGCELLFLASSGLTDAGVRSIATSERATGLRTLGLSMNEEITDDGARALADSPVLGALEVLELNGCELRAAGWRALIESKALAQLRKLVTGRGDLPSAVRKEYDARFPPRA